MPSPISGCKHKVEPPFTNWQSNLIRDHDTGMGQESEEPIREDIHEDALIPWDTIINISREILSCDTSFLSVCFFNQRPHVSLSVEYLPLNTNQHTENKT